MYEDVRSKGEVNMLKMARTAMWEPSLGIEAWGVSYSHSQVIPEGNVSR